VQSLIGLANERGGKDNVTVLLVRVIEAVPRSLSVSSA
jgi:serine/threonine protein phosphatase PrpC